MKPKPTYRPKSTPDTVDNAKLSDPKKILEEKQENGQDSVKLIITRMNNGYTEKPKPTPTTVTATPEIKKKYKSFGKFDFQDLVIFNN